MGHAWRVFVWCLGVLLLLLSVLTAFVGYVLPWGQMSFWGATVITSLASALPVVGNPLVSWLWGGLAQRVLAWLACLATAYAPASIWSWCMWSYCVPIHSSWAYSGVW